MKAGSYAGATFGLPVGLGVGLYVDSHGRAYPQLYGGTPGFSLSAGYTPDLEGLLTGPSVSWSPGVGAVRYNAGGNVDTMGSGVATATVGMPSVGVTHGFGPLEASKDYSKPWAKPAVRDSAASAGVPSRYNIFEYAYPDSEVALPDFDERWRGVGRSATPGSHSSDLGVVQKPSASFTDSAINSSENYRPAALLIDYIRRLNEQDTSRAPVSVFDVGSQALPFIADDGDGSFVDRFGDRPPIRRLSSWVHRG